MSGPLGIAVLLGCVASVDDLRRRRIANWINAGGLAAGLAYHAATGGWGGLARSAGGAAVGFVALGLLYVLGGMGGGDVKLAAAFGAVSGAGGVLLALLLAAPLGGALAAVSLARDWRTRAIPYAPALSLGAWLALLGRG